MSHRLHQASMQVLPGSSIVIPLRIDGLPERAQALGEQWQRKLEFHLTAVPAELIERAANGRPDVWRTVTEVVSGRALGPVVAQREVRRVTHLEKPGLRTLIVFADAPGIAELYRDLSQALGAELVPPPTHITLYSSDPLAGIGIADREQLAERAPALSETAQDEVRDAIAFEQVFFEDDGIALDPDDQQLVSIGRTDPRFSAAALRALAYAAHVHAKQRRKGGQIPYLAHLLAVASLVAEEGGNEQEIIGALLHDAAEDHGGERRLADISRRFGPEAEAMVRAMSDSLAPEDQRKAPWRERKERYLEHLQAEQSDAVLRVANADKLHNARSILADYRQHGDAIWERFQAPAPEQLWYYRRLVAIFEEKRAGRPMTRELSETVATLERELQAGA